MIVAECAKMLIHVIFLRHQTEDLSIGLLYFILSKSFTISNGEFIKLGENEWTAAVGGPGHFSLSGTELPLRRGRRQQGGV